MKINGVDMWNNFSALNYTQWLVDKQKSSTPSVGWILKWIWKTVAWWPNLLSVAALNPKESWWLVTDVVERWLEIIDPVSAQRRLDDDIRQWRVQQQQIDPNQWFALQYAQDQLNQRVWEIQSEQNKDRINQRAEEMLELEFNVDPDKIPEIAERATAEYWLPSDAPASLRAAFYIKTKQDEPEVLDEYRMWYFERIWEDLYKRARNIWPAYEKFRLAFDDLQDISDDEEYNMFVKDKETRKALRWIWAIAWFWSSVIWEVWVWALEAADNLVSWWMANREIYKALESDEVKNLFEKIINSEPGQDVLQFIEENPEAAADIWSVLNIGWLASEFIGWWAVGRAWRRVVDQAWRQIARTWIREAWEQAIRRVWDVWQELVQRWVNALPESVQMAWRRVWDVASSVSRGIRNLTDMWINKLAWIEDSTRRAVLDPRVAPFFDDLRYERTTKEGMFDNMIQAIKNRESEISDLWTAYDAIRNSWISVDVSDIKKSMDELLSSKKIKIVDWQLDFSDSALKDARSQWIVQRAYDDLASRKKIDPDVALNIRNGLDDLINYKTEVSPRWEALVKQIRKKYDDMIKKKISWLAELDQQYWPMRRELNAVKRDFFNADWSVKDTAFSRFINIAKDRNNQRLSRLQKLYPESEDISRAILAFEDVERAMWNKGGAYLQSLWWALLWTGAVSGTLVATAPLSLALFALSNPRTMVSVLQWLSKLSWKLKWINRSAKNFANDMIDKVSQWRFTKKDAEKLQDIVEKNDRVKDVLDSVDVTPDQGDINNIAEEVVDVVE